MPGRRHLRRGRDLPAQEGPRAAFVVNEGAGQWKQAIQLPGAGKLITGNGSAIGEVSCASATTCEVGGTLQTKAAKGFLAGETSGRWGTLYVLAPTITTLSCPAPGDCAAGGQRTNPLAAGRRENPEVCAREM
jgi:hypothetical protein